jgi:hypothetical protein
MLVHNLADAVRESERAKRDVRRERQLDTGVADSFCRAENWMIVGQPSPSQQAIRIEDLLGFANGFRNCPRISAKRSSCIICREGPWLNWRRS